MKQTVDKHIVTLLQDHDCVIIPNFGGLIAQYTPVRIHPVRHSMAPPSKRIAFNEKLQLNDGRLISHISLKEELSAADAAERVQVFVQTVNLALNQHQRYQLQHIGLFRKEPGQGISFEYEEKINLLADSFGLPEVFSKPIQRHRSLAEIRKVVNENVAPKLQPAEGAKTISIWQRALRYAAILPIVALSASALYLAGLDTGLEMSNLNPVSYLLQQRPDVSSVATFKTGNTRPSGNLTTEEYEQRLTDLGFEANKPAAPTAYLTDPYLLLQTPQELPTPPAEEVTPSEPATDTDSWEVTPTEVAAPVTPAPAAERVAPVSEAVAEVKNIQARTGRFYIIAGGFIEPSNAEQLQSRAQKNGLDAKIIEPAEGSRLHRVSLADFETREEALARVSDLTPTYGKALWVLEY